MEQSNDGWVLKCKEHGDFEMQIFSRVTCSKKNNWALSMFQERCQGFIHPSSSRALRQGAGQGRLLWGLFPGSLQFGARGGARQPELCSGYEMRRRVGEWHFWPTPERRPEGSNDQTEIHKNYLRLAKATSREEWCRTRAQPLKAQVERRWLMPRDGHGGHNIQCFSNANLTLGTAADFRQRIDI